MLATKFFGAELKAASKSAKTAQVYLQDGCLLTNSQLKLSLCFSNIYYLRALIHDAVICPPFLVDRIFRILLPPPLIRPSQNEGMAG